MAMTIHVDIVSAEGHLYSGQGEMVYAPAVMGEIGIAPRHAPLVTQLKPGEVRVDPGQGAAQEHFYVSGGMIEVQPFKVTVLADTGIRAADLDHAAAEEAKRRAEDALANRAADIDLAKAQVELAEAAAQLRAIERLRKTK
jgi:F-type H+-transporting ATPase subunit epsilon